MKPVTKILTLLIISQMIICGISCSSSNENESMYPDTLRVGVIYSPSSFFLFRGDTMGYDYERITAFAKEKGLSLDIKIEKSLSSLIRLLEADSIDLVAYEVPVTQEYNELVLHCGSEVVTHQVLIQRSDMDTLVTDVTQLINKVITVEKDSKYQSRLENLDNEIGGGLEISTIESDTISTEDLIDLVSNGTIDYTVVDSDIAAMNQGYYNNIDATVDMSFPQKASWAVSLKSQWLADSINSWCQSQNEVSVNKKLLKRYYELEKSNIPIRGKVNSVLKASLKKGYISDFDDLFKKHAKSLDWDWRLLAALSWAESGFDPTQESRMGAKGLMQVLPSSAQHHGVDSAAIMNPDVNLRAAVEILKKIDKALKSKVPDKEERIKFDLAAYNSGLAHVLDAIRLANKYGKNPEKWNASVEEAMIWKGKPEFYNDEVCTAGYSRGKQTATFVSEVLSHYTLFKTKVKE